MPRRGRDRENEGEQKRGGKREERKVMKGSLSSQFPS
jgi:hypothetical protein